MIGEIHFQQFDQLVKRTVYEPHRRKGFPMKTLQRQGTAPIGKLLFEYSLPAIAGFLINALYQFVDRILVGRGVGTEGMAAVTSAYPITILTMGIGLLLGTGSGNLISTYLGQGRKEEAEKVLGQSFRSGLLWGTAVAILLGIFSRPILRVCGASGVVLEMAIPYLRISAIGQIFIITLISLGNILRVQGRPNLGLLFMVFGNVLNAALAAIGIFWLKLGVSGAAWATTIAIFLNLTGILIFLQSKHSGLRIRRQNLVWRPEIVKSITKLGAPVFLMQILGTLTFLAANHGAGALGGARGIAMVGIFNTVSILLIYPPLGIAQAMQPLLAFNQGKGHTARVRQILGTALFATTAIGVVSALVVACFPGLLASLFSKTDLTLIEMVRVGIPWFMISVALFGIQGTTSHYFLATQQPKMAAILLLGRQILAIPMFLLLPHWFGILGLYLVALVSDVPFALVAAVLLQREWKKLTSEIDASGESDPEELDPILDVG